MKLIKYDDWGRVVSSKSSHIPEIEGAQKPEDIPELNLFQPMTRKRTIRGLFVGFMVGIPLGILIELFRLLTSGSWSGPFWGIVVFAATVIISGVVGYIQGSMTDRE